MTSSRCLFSRQTDFGLVEVREEAPFRWLSIDAIEQSRIDLRRPEKLLSAHNHAFLAARLFHPEPRRVLLAGLGGGSFARYFFELDPTISGECVEINAAVVEATRRYFPLPDRQWQLFVDDIRHWQGRDYDLILVDFADRTLTPSWLCQPAMLTRLRRQLGHRGILIVNTLPRDGPAMAGMLTRIRQIFAGRTLCLGVPGYRNIVVFAFARRPDASALQRLETLASELGQDGDIDFRGLLERLRRDNPPGSGIL